MTVKDKVKRIEENLDILQFVAGELENCPNCESTVKILDFKKCPYCGYDFKIFHKLNNNFDEFMRNRNES